MFSIAHPDFTKNLDAAAKFFRTVMGAGVTAEQLALPVNDRTARRNFAEFLAAGCPKVNYTPEGNTAVAKPTPKGYSAAKRILGGDFVSPQEVMDARPGVVYDASQLKALVDNIPSAEVLQQLKDNGFALVPQPPQPMSLLDVRALESGQFYSQTGGWYADYAFAKDNKTGTGWLAIKKTPVDGSLSKTWDEQNRLLKDGESVPNAAEMSWFITTFFKVRGVRLFERLYVRCSDLVSDGGRVFVGVFDSEGLSVNGCLWDGYRSSLLGLASARK